MDVDEFKIKIMPLKDKLFRIVKRLLNDYETSEDALQEIMIKLWDKRNELEKHPNLEALVVTITKNYCIDLIRTKKIIPMEMNEEILEHHSDNPEIELEKSEVNNVLNNAISKLPDIQKLILQLKDIEGYSYEEIANILDKSVGTIRVTLSRARNQLRNILVNKYKFNYEKY
ncbi:RNA polymerase sigma factor [Bacteroidetes/Chlorobi group bacterium ChocPot_Mid]|nr:MAG: RNA polymerase sigma factor [Bacteroidetes/Chlorobi group bacterium ChocPot_Mid]